MLPAALLLVIGVELALCAWVGWQLMGGEMAGRWGELTVCILLWLLAVRLVVVAASFAVAARYTEPAARLAPLAWAGLVLREYAATLLAFSVLIPAAALFAPRLSRRADLRGATVVLLVHGFLSNRGIWWWFARRLRAAGVWVDSVDLAAPFAPLEAHVRRLDTRLGALAARAPARIVLVGHSMGGLVCRAWLAAHAPGPVARLVTIATPHAGSLLARGLPAPNLRQMCPGSGWLAALPMPQPVPLTALYSPHDNLVVPAAGARCELADTNEAHAGLGHLGLLFSAGVAARVRRAVVGG
jgi:triacylglycerol lipase